MSRGKKMCHCERCGSSIPKNRRFTQLEAISREDRKRDTEVIRDHDLTLDYGLVPGGRVTAAYKWDEKFGRVNLYFAVRSIRDPFSRPHARRAIAKHIKEDTHHLKFKLNSAGRYYEAHDRMRLASKLAELLIDRMLSHPSEFTAKDVAHARRTKEMTDAISEVESALSKFLGTF